MNLQGISMNKKSLIALAVMGVLSVPSYVAAAETDAEIYGKINVSIDFYSNALVNDVTTDSGDSGIDVSSNSSRLGFKGSHKFEDSSTSLIWQIESQVNFNNYSTSTLASRNTFVGFKGGFGKFIVGYYDTPMKQALTKWDPFGDSVGEGRAVLGQPGGNGDTDYNIRARNSIVYTTPSFGGFKIVGQYSADVNSGSDADNNDNSLYDIGFQFATQDKKWQAWGAYENQDGIGANGEAATGYRISAKWVPGALGIGLIYENTDDPNAGTRNGYGGYVGFKLNPRWDIAAAYFMVDDFENVDNSGGNVPTIGVQYAMDKATKFYFIYAALSQDEVADYALGRRGHGNHYYGTAPGEDPSAFSMGMTYKF
jgi:predicted porin